MATATSKPTFKDLRAEAQRLGVTAESAGCSIDELLRTARESDDPLGYLAIYAPPDASAGPIEPRREAESDAADEDDDDEPQSPVPPPVAAPAPSPQSKISIVAPLVDAMPTGYVTRHVEIRLSPDQAKTLRRLHLALDAQGERLANKRRVIHLPDALKWLLERLAAGRPERPAGDR